MFKNAATLWTRTRASFIIHAYKINHATSQSTTTTQNKLTFHNQRYAVTQLVEALRYKPEGRGFFEIFHLALGSTHVLTEMSTRYLTRGEGRVKAAVCRADNLANFTRRLSENPESLNLLQPSGTI